MSGTLKRDFEYSLNIGDSGICSLIYSTRLRKKANHLADFRFREHRLRVRKRIWIFLSDSLDKGRSLKI